MRTFFHFGIALLLTFSTPLTAFSQLNMVLQDSMTYTVGTNDVCGWVAADGKEYALVGLNTGVAIVDINEDSLKQVAFVPGQNNLWRDINTYGHYAYVSSEAHIGLLIIDLQYLPDSVQTYVWMDSLPTINGPQPFLKAHSLWVDEYGICYLNGSNLNSGGAVLIDVASNPTDPVFLGYGPPIYAHDVYSRDSIMYSAEIYNGDASIYDVHDPQNITLLGRVKTPYEFTHNVWVSDNSRYMFTTDERANSYVTSYDIADPGNIIELDRYRQAATEGSGNIVHNVYVWNDWLVVAYYANGTTIVDGSRPDNLVEVGNFDSFLGPDGGFPGVWGTFPWMPSGKILSSNRNSGLYVFIPNYVRASFLEGTVIDSVTRLPIDNALVSIVSDEIVLPQASKPDGVFKMGKAIPGEYNITIKKEGYYEKTISLNFINGSILAPLVELVKRPLYAVSGKVIDSEDADVPFAKVSLVSFDGVYETTCDENGNFLVPAVYAGSYALQSGVWGQTYETILELNEPKSLTIQLIKGYKDDFDVDLGWTVEGPVSSGMWVRGIPTQQKLFNLWVCSSDGDSAEDIGSLAYSTGLSSSENVADSEVSGGTTWLISPPMNLENAIDPKISFDYWLCEFPPNQYVGLSVWLTSGLDTILLEELRNDTIVGSWQSKTYEPLTLPEPSEHVQFLISARDTTSGTGNYYLKVHFDHFKVTEGTISAVNPLSETTHFIIYPNPVSDGTFYVKPQSGLITESLTLHIYDMQGRLLSSYDVQPGAPQVRINHSLENGLYFIQWADAKGVTGTDKILVLKK